ncbi:MAG: 7TM diverse intracellular signaling domain-containing protein [Thermaurantimonas sp.]
MALKRLTLIVYLNVLFLTQVSALRIINITSDQDLKSGRSVSTYFKYYIDSSNTVSVGNLTQHIDSFVPWNKDNFHLGTNLNPVWLCADISNLSYQEVILELGYPIIDSIEFYLLRNGVVVKEYFTGSSYPFQHREINGNYFKFIIPPGQYQVFIRVKSFYNIQFPLKMYSWRSLNEHNVLESNLQGIYMGFVVLIVLYNLFLYFTIKDPIYYWYVFHTLATALITLHLNGYTFKYLWPEAPVINTYEPMIYGLGIFTTLFSIKFLRPESFSKFWTVVLWGIFWVNVPVFVLPFLGQKMLANVLVQLVGSIGCLLMLIAGIALMIRGYRPAFYYVIAFSFLLVGVIVSILSRMNVLPNEPLLIHASQIGSAFDIVLLSIAVADRVNEGLKEREKLKESLFRETIEKENIIRQQNLLLKEEVEKQTKNLREANAAITETAAELKAKNEYLNKLLTIIGHDLKGSLSNVTGLLDAYKDDPKAYDRSVLQMLQSSARKTSSILQNLLIFAQINTSDLRPVRRTVCVGQVLRKVEEQIKLQADIKSIVLDIDFETDALIVADEFYLEVVLRNLLVNSVKFTPQGGKVSVQVRESAGGRVEIEVSDTGVGMSDEQVNSFFLKDGADVVSTGTAGEKGTGIGRVLIKELVDAMKGTIELRSKPGLGTTFTLTFEKATSET